MDFSTSTRSSTRFAAPKRSRWENLRPIRSDLAQTFGAGEKFEGTKVPAGAAVLIGLGILFLLHTAGLFEFGLDRFWPLILICLGVWLFAKHWGLIGGNSGVCHCERCRTRRLMGPAMLVTLGVLFLLDSVSRVEFGRTWPAILLVIGVVKLMQSNASSAGHVGPLPPECRRMFLRLRHRFHRRAASTRRAPNTDLPLAR